MERMGLSSKLSYQILSYNQAVKYKNAQPDKDWLAIAIDRGYYHYQRQVRDFREFTKMTPNEFLLRESNAPERSFGHKEI
jgi:hypothetical protein